MPKFVLVLTLTGVVCAQVITPNTGRRSRPQQPQTRISDLETPVATFQGTLRSVSKSEIVLGMREDQSIVFHISHKTKFLKDAKPIKPSAIPPGASLTVDGKRDLKGNVEAVTVTVDPAKKPAEPAPAPASAGSTPPPQ
jgi:hypothetical protein